MKAFINLLKNDCNDLENDTDLNENDIEENLKAPFEKLSNLSEELLEKKLYRTFYTDKEVIFKFILTN
jgi:hypothetical protein